MTPEAVDKISPYLDAATVDFKGAGDPKFYGEIMGVSSVEPIYTCLEAMMKHGIHIEITNLAVPEYGDSEERLRELASWTRLHLGSETPFHILRFYPSYELIDVPSTPVATIEREVKIAQEEGLKYVYAGNVPGHDGENTYCPECHEMLIRRDSFNIVGWNLTRNMTCPKCGKKIPIKGHFHGRV
jgi:pyruvate formate lyase activating enzyme